MTWIHFPHYWPFTRIQQKHFGLLDGVVKWKHFLHYWPFVRGIHWAPVNSSRKGQWRRALMFSLICAWTNGWANNWNASDLWCHCTHYNVTVMGISHIISWGKSCRDINKACVTVPIPLTCVTASSITNNKYKYPPNIQKHILHYKSPSAFISLDVFYHFMLYCGHHHQ